MSYYLQEIIIGLVTVVLTILLFFGIYTFVSSTISARDDKIWNNGHCDVCGGTWQYEQAVGHRSSTTYIYVCKGCGKRIELNWVK